MLKVIGWHRRIYLIVINIWVALTIISGVLLEMLIGLIDIMVIHLCLIESLVHIVDFNLFLVILLLKALLFHFLFILP